MLVLNYFQRVQFQAIQKLKLNSVKIKDLE